MRQTRDYKTTILLIVFSLCLIVAGIFNVSTAYFTSIDSRSGDINFHTVSLQVNSTNSGNVMFTKTVNVIPGDEISFSHISVKNTGSASVYSIICLEVSSIKADSSKYVDTIWYNLSSAEIDSDNLTENKVGATELASQASKSLTLKYKFDGNVYNDTFKKADTIVKITAYCIQKDNLETINSITDKALIATYMMIDNFVV